MVLVRFHRLGGRMDVRGECYDTHGLARNKSLSPISEVPHLCDHEDYTLLQLPTCFGEVFLLPLPLRSPPSPNCTASSASLFNRFHTALLRPFLLANPDRRNPQSAVGPHHPAPGSRLSLESLQHHQRQQLARTPLSAIGHPTPSLGSTPLTLNSVKGVRLPLLPPSLPPLCSTSLLRQLKISFILRREKHDHSVPNPNTPQTQKRQAAIL